MLVWTTVVVPLLQLLHGFISVWVVTEFVVIVPVETDVDVLETGS